MAALCLVFRVFSCWICCFVLRVALGFGFGVVFCGLLLVRVGWFSVRGVLVVRFNAGEFCLGLRWLASVVVGGLV